MAVLTTSKRKKLKKSQFALPGERKYPVYDKAHASNAKARAQQQYDKGSLSKSELDTIDRKADKVLYGKKGDPYKNKGNPHNGDKKMAMKYDSKDRKDEKMGEEKYMKKKRSMKNKVNRYAKKAMKMDNVERYMSSKY